MLRTPPRPTPTAPRFPYQTLVRSGRRRPRRRRGDPGDARSWDFAEWGIDGPDEFDRLHRLAVLEHRMFRKMPALPGVAEALWRLSDAGVWIRIITHRLCVHRGHAVDVAVYVPWLDEAGHP